MSTIEIQSRGISNVYTQSTFAKDYILESWKVPFGNILSVCSPIDSIQQNVKHVYSNGVIEITNMKDFMNMLYRELKNTGI